jgi:hypothetical protein
VFDGLLFNFVAPIRVPALLGATHGEPVGTAHITTVTSVVTAARLVGWATGGILFDLVTDPFMVETRVSRTHAPS